MVPEEHHGFHSFVYGLAGYLNQAKASSFVFVILELPMLKFIHSSQTYLQEAMHPCRLHAANVLWPSSWLKHAHASSTR